MKRALVMSGGGARGSFQVGMLEELVINQGLDFEVIRGVSVGALNASFLSQANFIENDPGSVENLKNEVRALKSLWLDDVEGNQSVYSNRAGFAGLIAGGDSLYSLKPLRTLLDEKLDIDRVEASNRKFKVGTVSLVSSLYQEWGPGDNEFFEKIMASASIPVVFPFVDVPSEEDVLVDGGVRNITPLSSAFKEQPDEIYVLLTSRLEKKPDGLPSSGAEHHSYKKWNDNWLGTSVGGLDVLERTLDILTDEIYLEDIKSAKNWNTVAEAINTLENIQKATQGIPDEINNGITNVVKALQDVHKRKVKIYVLAPQVWFDENAEEGNKNSSTKFSPRLIEKAIEHGKEIAADRSQWLMGGN
ncbi:MAG: hypothetical protein G3M70_02080 [Candidatus Nitronauta litoralis]|uniref:PNPLA domain-containing protein n=1 Tax=Candidatus Nitronauta litoralis TaxID=2705533 RepID=A0A7T0FYY5_9BACT|nr:MAG: hypothetical protein G3M70_02080 [Candidatus Nitronauta litoralis]